MMTAAKCQVTHSTSLKLLYNTTRKCAREHMVSVFNGSAGNHEPIRQVVVYVIISGNFLVNILVMHGFCLRFFVVRNWSIVLKAKKPQTAVPGNKETNIIRAGRTKPTEMQHSICFLRIFSDQRFCVIYIRREGINAF